MGRTPLAWLADRLILIPTRHPLDVAGKTRRTIPFAGGLLECWTHRTGPAEREPDVFVLKYPGAGGRAERATDHPLGGWPDWCGEIWAVNAPGYGGSPGRATLQTLVGVAHAALEEVQRAAAGRPILVTGSSLGAAAALAAAAHTPIAGLLLRNPPPLREVIRGRFGNPLWGWFTERIARRIPEPLCAITNARHATAPAVFVVSGRDSIVPPQYQQLIIDAYAGEKQVLRLLEADHHTPLTVAEQREYQTLLDWLRQRITAGGGGARA